MHTNVALHIYVLLLATYTLVYIHIYVYVRRYASHIRIHNYTYIHTFSLQHIHKCTYIYESQTSLTSVRFRMFTPSEMIEIATKSDEWVHNAAPKTYQWMVLRRCIAMHGCPCSPQ